MSISPSFAILLLAFVTHIESLAQHILSPHISSFSRVRATRFTLRICSGDTILVLLGRQSHVKPDIDLRRSRKCPYSFITTEYNNHMGLSDVIPDTDLQETPRFYQAGCTCFIQPRLTSIRACGLKQVSISTTLPGWSPPSAVTAHWAFFIYTIISLREFSYKYSHGL